MPHELYNSIDEMLAPEIFSELVARSVKYVRCLAFHQVGGVSGSHLLAIQLDSEEEPGYILKRICRQRDWIMRATDDHLCRSVRLWQSGLFDQLPSEIEHGIVACAIDGEGWAVLMRNLSTTIAPYARFSVATNECFLNALAALHATFWLQPNLTDPALGLCNPGQLYTAWSPQAIQREPWGREEYPQRILGGWQMFDTLIDPDVGEIVHELLADPQPLCRALACYPHTLAHGDCHAGNLGLLQGARRQVVMLDWQFATVAPPAFDLARYLSCTSALLPISKEGSIAYYRQRLAYHLGADVEENWWQPQLELGLLGSFLQESCAIAGDATDWPSGEGTRDHWRADLAWWSEQVRTALKWL